MMILITALVLVARVSIELHMILYDMKKLGEAAVVTKATGNLNIELREKIRNFDRDAFIQHVSI